MSAQSGPRRRVRALDPGDPLAVLARIVGERRLRLALTQADVAALAGVSVAAVHKLENRQTILLPVALSILDVLGLSVAVAPRTALPESALLPPMGAQHA